MFHQARVLCLLACVAGWSIPGLAQPVYRCGDTYSNTPCPGGREVQTEDARTPAQQAQTSAAARRDAKLADEMEKTRLKQEAKAPGVTAVPPAVAEPPQAAASDRTYSPVRAKKPAYFTAVSPKKAGEKATRTKKVKKKARKPAA